jgi:cell division transport system ATP-binding protein
VKAALSRVDLSEQATVSPRVLSGGQQQRVGIARAIVHRPALLVADEPTGNLDPELSARVMRMFTQFQQLGVTILVATHERAVVESLPFRRLVIEQGRLVSDGMGASR